MNHVQDRRVLGVLFRLWVIYALGLVLAFLVGCQSTHLRSDDGLAAAYPMRKCVYCGVRYKWHTQPVSGCLYSLRRPPFAVQVPLYETDEALLQYQRALLYGTFTCESSMEQLHRMYGVMSGQPMHCHGSLAH